MRTVGCAPPDYRPGRWSAAGPDPGGRPRGRAEAGWQPLRPAAVAGVRRFGRSRERTGFAVRDAGLTR